MLQAYKETRTGTVTFHPEPLPTFVELERMWRGLDCTGSHSFFASWSWIGPLLATTGSKVKLLIARRGLAFAGMAVLGFGAGHLGGIVPLRRAFLNATGDPEFDSVLIEHNGFALPGGPDDTLLPSLARWFRHGGLKANELSVPGVEAESVEAGRWCVETRRAAYRTPLAEMGEAGLVSILSRNARQQLRRSLRDYGDAVRLDRAATVSEALDYFAALKDLHVRSWDRRGRSHAFAKPFFERFHRAVIEQGVPEGTVDLLRLSAGNRTLGYLYNFVRNGVVSSYQSGLADDEPGLRPGYVCHALAIDHYAAKGLRTYDFLAGTNRLKESFGVETYQLSWLQVRRPHLVFWMDDLFHKAADVLKH